MFYKRIKFIKKKSGKTKSELSVIKYNKLQRPVLLLGNSYLDKDSCKPQEVFKI